MKSLNCLLVIAITLLISGFSPSQESKEYLYVAVPGIRNYLEYGGHGILVYDKQNNYQFVKRIPTRGLKQDGTPSNVKGVGVSLATNSIYVTTLEALQRIDLASDKVIWEKTYEGGCDRLSISPDGKTIYLPTLEKEHWNVVGYSLKYISSHKNKLCYGSVANKRAINRLRK